jgi:hypothetical protein
MPVLTAACPQAYMHLALEEVVSSVVPPNVILVYNMSLLGRVLSGVVQLLQTELLSFVWVFLIHRGCRGVLTRRLGKGPSGRQPRQRLAVRVIPAASVECRVYTMRHGKHLAESSKQCVETDGQYTDVRRCEHWTPGSRTRVAFSKRRPHKDTWNGARVHMHGTGWSRHDTATSRRPGGPTGNACVSSHSGDEQWHVCIGMRATLSGRPCGHMPKLGGIHQQQKQWKGVEEIELHILRGNDLDGGTDCAGMCVVGVMALGGGEMPPYGEGRGQTPRKKTCGHVKSQGGANPGGAYHRKGCDEMVPGRKWGGLAGRKQSSCFGVAGTSSPGRARRPPLCCAGRGDEPSGALGCRSKWRRWYSLTAMPFPPLPPTLGNVVKGVG